MLKCLVLDLDNTIWGGVVGEDGVDGIRLTPEYLDVQRAALELGERGVLLVVCSKNNLLDVLPVFERPDMLLKMTDFTKLLINWWGKEFSLRELAKHLNIGLDSLAFADDSPTERGLVKAQLPEVTVIDLPDNPAGYAAAIRAAFATDATVTEEDTKRSGYYAEQKRRMEAEQQATSREEYLHSLGLKLEVGRATRKTLLRIVQLSDRTNQFTLSGSKYTENQLGPMLFPSSYFLPPQPWSHRWIAYWARLKDRFGDYGIIAAAILRGEEMIDFYLSCRAMGRGVECAFLGAILADNNRAITIAPVTMTNRNSPAAEFFAALAPGARTAAPPWITVCAPWLDANHIVTRIKDIACEIFGLPQGSLSNEASPENVAQWDSLAAINLMLALEDEFKIVFTAEEMEIAPSLGQIAEMIQAKKGTK